MKITLKGTCPACGGPTYEEVDVAGLVANLEKSGATQLERTAARVIEDLAIQLEKKE